MLWILVLSQLTLPVLGQNDRSQRAESSTRAAVGSEFSSQILRIETADDLNANEKAKATEWLKSAIAAAEASAGFLEHAQKHAAAIAGIESQLKVVKDELSQPVSKIEPVDGSLSLKELDSEVQQKTVALESLRQEVATYRDALAARETRLIEIPKVTAEANSRLSKLEKELNDHAQASGSQQVLTAHSAMLEQQKVAVQSEIEALKQENAWQLANSELLPLQHDLAKREFETLQDQLEDWQAAAQGKRETEVDRDIRAAESLLQAASPPLRELAESNLATAKERRETEAALKAATDRQEELKAVLAKLDRQFTRAQNESQTESTITESVGAILRQQRNELPDIQLHSKASDARQQSISEARLKLFLLREEQSELTDLDSAVDVQSRELGLRSDRNKELGTLLDARRDLLKGLVTDTNALFQALAKLDGTETNLIALSKRVATFIDERVLWIRSTQWFGPAPLWESVAVATSWIRSMQWAELPKLLLARLRKQPLIPAVCLTLLVGILIFGLRLRRSIREYGDRAEAGSCRDFGLTLRASLLTIGISVVGPGIVYWIGLWMRGGEWDNSGILGSLSNGLIAAAAVYLPLELWRQAARRKGLLESHFGVAARSAEIVRANLLWLTLLLVPAVGVLAAIQELNNPLYDRSIARVVFAFCMLLLVLFVYRVADPKRSVSQVLLGHYRGGMLYKTRYVWFASLLAVPLALVILSIIGFHFTAVQLASRLQWTCFLAIALVFFHDLALRWVVLSRRRLAIEQARARLARSSEQLETGPGSVEAQVNLQAIDLESVDLQTRRLVRAITVVVGALAFWSVWVEVLPALSRFDDYKAWDVQVPTVVASDSGSGESSTVTTAFTVKQVSYADVAIALAIFIGTLLAMRDVPGLLELVVLQRLPLDVALRLAITTLTRYMIFLFGMVWALGTIEIGWSKVQWLVAAVSIGLGFGLQEIFANFVSGIIILFERPLRAGDIVTVDDVTGTVINVQMRATTIQDLDRKDFIVPNKDFITGRVLNWTLSDEVSRIVVRVGVAYGSDTEKAKSLMLATAENHPLIVGDPIPQVAFEEFGDSSLNLVLRCYLALQSMSGRLAVIDALNTAIDQAFRAASIEIAFPQRDLHLRSVDGQRCTMDLRSSVGRGESDLASRPSK